MRAFGAQTWRLEKSDRPLRQGGTSQFLPGRGQIRGSRRRGPRAQRKPSAVGLDEKRLRCLGAARRIVNRESGGEGARGLRWELARFRGRRASELPQNFASTRGSGRISIVNRQWHRY